MGATKIDLFLDIDLLFSEVFYNRIQSS